MVGSQEAARYRHHAEELRRKAELMSDAETSGQYLRLAEAYEALAGNEAKIASNSETK
jgi:hypothetical protein